MIDRATRTLSKPCIDVGYFTNEPDAMLAFWREEMGLAAEPPVEFNDGLTQHRHALGDSVVKINTARDGVRQTPCSYRELLIADDAVSAPRALADPDGNRIVCVPPGYLGVRTLGLRLVVGDAARQAAFYRDVMGFRPHGAASFVSGDAALVVEQGSDGARAGHWVGAGLRYFTLHVMQVDAAFDDLVAAGAEVGERPYSIGRIARISFVRDPHGNWIEVAQRAALAGPWWEEE